MPLILMDTTSRRAIAVDRDTYLIELSDIEASLINLNSSDAFDALERGVLYGTSSVLPLLEALENVVEP
jgi:hypothetical protein